MKMSAGRFCSSQRVNGSSSGPNGVFYEGHLEIHHQKMGPFLGILLVVFVGSSDGLSLLSQEKGSCQSSLRAVLRFVSGCAAENGVFSHSCLFG